MVLRYLTVAALAAGSTYGALALNPTTEPAALICRFSSDAGEELTLEDGPIGPRLGSLDYLAQNLTHEEKIRLVSSEEFDSAGVIERMATDIVRNRDRALEDIYRSVQRALGVQ